MKENATSPSAREFTDAKNLISVLISAFKFYGFYPDNHSSTIKTVENVKTNIESFLEKYGDARFQIEKDRLLYKGEMVYCESDTNDSIALILYRDGIQWIEFQIGLERWEIRDFVKIVKKHWVLQDDPEDDIVTALYTSDMPHLRYEASDDLWRSVPLLDFSQLNVSGPEISDGDQAEGNGQPSDDPEDQKAGGEANRPNDRFLPNLAEISMDRSRWNLTSEEVNAVNEMIREENNRDWASDINDLLIIVLKREREKDNVKAILEYLLEEFKDLLRIDEFGSAIDLLKKIAEFYRLCIAEKKWCVPILKNFLDEIHGEKTFNTLLPALQKVSRLDGSRSEKLLQLLHAMRSSAIYALGPMLSLIDSEKDRDFLLDVIVFLAKKNFNPLMQLLVGEDETILLNLIPALEKLEGPEVLDLLLNKMIVHTSATTRSAALKVLMKKNYRETARLFPLIDDPDEKIRTRFLYYIAQEKNTSNENLLRNYLEKEKYTHKSKDHIIACYKTLGKCGSERSESFLTDLLSERPGKSFFTVNPSTHQIGAAFALISLGTDTSKKAFEQASKSLNPSIRLACRRVMKEKNVR